MIGELIEEISDNAADSGDLNILLKDIISRGQVARDIVEQRLRYHRMEDEQVLRMVVADAEKDDRLEAMAKRKAAWRKRFDQLETERVTGKMSLLSVVDWEEVMEVDRVSRDVTMDREGDVIMVDYSARTPVFGGKSRKRFRSRILQVTGRVKELGLIMEISEPGEPASKSNAGYQTMGIPFDSHPKIYAFS